MPLQAAALMTLPEGVPDELHVACAGRLAVLTVRSQTVTFGGQTMSASRFEAVCGKGDAKKWKSSLWAASPEGIPLQVGLGFRGNRDSTFPDPPSWPCKGDRLCPAKTVCGKGLPSLWGCQLGGPSHTGASVAVSFQGR